MLQVMGKSLRKQDLYIVQKDAPLRYVLIIKEEQ